MEIIQIKLKGFNDTISGVILYTISLGTDYIVYSQNRIARYFVGRDSNWHLHTLVNYCVIPEADSLLINS